MREVCKSSASFWCVIFQFSLCLFAVKPHPDSMTDLVLFRPNSFTLITANRVMNFIADSPEDVNGWVEGMNAIITPF